MRYRFGLVLYGAYQKVKNLMEIQELFILVSTIEQLL